MIRKLFIMKIVIVGSGVAGSEVGTYLGQRARKPLEIVEIECEPTRRFGGWGFQRFPGTETTNLAVHNAEHDILRAECIGTFPSVSFPATLLLRLEEVET